MADDGWVGLSDAVRALRLELISAMVEGQGRKLRFELGTVEMEFLLEVKKEGGGEAGVKFGVLSLAGKAGMSSGSTHRVKLVLTPTDVVTGRPPTISDRE